MVESCPGGLRKLAGGGAESYSSRSGDWRHRLISRGPFGTTDFSARRDTADHCGSITMRTAAKAKTAAAKTNARTRTRRCSNFPDALAKKSTVAKRTVFARY